MIDLDVEGRGMSNELGNHQFWARSREGFGSTAASLFVTASRLESSVSSYVRARFSGMQANRLLELVSSCISLEEALGMCRENATQRTVPRIAICGFLQEAQGQWSRFLRYLK